MFVRARDYTELDRIYLINTKMIILMEIDEQIVRHGALWLMLKEHPTRITLDDYENILKVIEKEEGIL